MVLQKALILKPFKCIVLKPFKWWAIDCRAGFIIKHCLGGFIQETRVYWQTITDGFCNIDIC